MSVNLHILWGSQDPPIMGVAGHPSLPRCVEIVVIEVADIFTRGIRYRDISLFPDAHVLLLVDVLDTRICFAR